MKEVEKAVELIKRSSAGSIKYVKVSYAPATSTYHLKIFLLRPLEWRVLSEVVKELEKTFSIRVYVPHAKALRLDLKKRS